MKQSDKVGLFLFLLVMIALLVFMGVDDAKKDKEITEIQAEIRGLLDEIGKNVRILRDENVQLKKELAGRR